VDKNDPMIRHTALAAILLGLAANQAPAHDKDFRVSDLRAQFLYERSGTLSVDITDNPRFNVFNSVIGEGSAAEPASDLLVSAVVTGPDERILTVPLVITVRNEKGKLVASRTITRILAGKAYVRSILLKDVGCAGPLGLEARLGKSVRREKINMLCGE
jgi:hypothetical protein